MNYKTLFLILTSVTLFAKQSMAIKTDCRGLYIHNTTTATNYNNPYASQALEHAKTIVFKTVNRDFGNIKIIGEAIKDGHFYYKVQTNGAIYHLCLKKGATKSSLKKIFRAFVKITTDPKIKPILEKGIVSSKEEAQALSDHFKSVNDNHGKSIVSISNEIFAIHFSKSHVIFSSKGSDSKVGGGGDGSSSSENAAAKTTVEVPIEVKTHNSNDVSASRNRNLSNSKISTPVYIQAKTTVETPIEVIKYKPSELSRLKLPVKVESEPNKNNSSAFQELAKSNTAPLNSDEIKTDKQENSIFEEEFMKIDSSVKFSLPEEIENPYCYEVSLSATIFFIINNEPVKMSINATYMDTKFHSGDMHSSGIRTAFLTTMFEKFNDPKNPIETSTGEWDNYADHPNAIKGAKEKQEGYVGRLLDDQNPFALFPTVDTNREILEWIECFSNPRYFATMLYLFQSEAFLNKNTIAYSKKK